MLDFILKYHSELLSVICVLLYASVGFKKSTPKSILYITLYLCGYSVINIIVSVYSAYGWNNHYLSHLYFIMQFVFLSLFYKSLFTKFQKKIVTITFIIIMIILLVQYIVYPNMLVQLNPLEVLITCSPLVTYSIIHLYNSLTAKAKYIYINAGVLFYISISTLIFILFRYLNSSDLIFIRKPILTVNKLLIVCYLVLFIIEYKKSIWKFKLK